MLGLPWFLKNKNFQNESYENNKVLRYVLLCEPSS